MNPKDFGFDNVREFVLYHWSKLSFQDQQELRSIGIIGGDKK